MERVSALVEKLQNQIAAGISEDDIIITVQLLYGELITRKRITAQTNLDQPFVSTSLPVPELKIPAPYTANASANESLPEGEKIVDVLKIDEKEIEEELNQIKKNAEIKNSLSTNARQDLKSFDEKESDISIGKNLTLNDQLKETKTELSEKLNDTPIKDLKKSIGVNDRYVFISELFNNDEALFEKSIKTINGFSIFPEAEYWIKRELKLRLGWKESSEAAKQFDQLVRRRFL